MIIARRESARKATDEAGLGRAAAANADASDASNANSRAKKRRTLRTPGTRTFWDEMQEIRARDRGETTSDIIYTSASADDSASARAALELTGAAAATALPALGRVGPAPNEPGFNDYKKTLNIS